MISDQEIIAKYNAQRGKVIQEYNRIQLPELVEKMGSNPNYMMMDDTHNDWSNIQKSRLIESFIINFPVLPIIVYETSIYNYKIIDGKQRIKAIVDYYNNKFPLTGLKVTTELNGCTYAHLPVKIREVLNRYPLKFINILFQNDVSPEQIAKLLEIVAESYP
ncbi:DUF262 domain-containing protein [Anabaena sp. UHCC 0187]|uniref:DUF262 domain-containing protein n=1 Tax=Anabaena sp. UHCC 0187 TaxID=2590018 RepID=UPI001447D9CB|nr:DUF262 domain-containing protein [Anabaena sp. UHCC 0187]MTJ14698.1 DUF262 domain-containing protein [Anabaena sp. UHCC 0187]